MRREYEREGKDKGEGKSEREREGCTNLHTPYK